MEPTSEPQGRSGSPWKKIIAVAAIVAVVGGGIWLWDTFKYDLFPKRFGVVVEGVVYRSGQLSPAQVGKTLKKYDIDLVLALNGHDASNPEHVAT